MGLEVVDKVYATNDFTGLSEHNAQTPSTFFGGPPILHLLCPISHIRLDKDTISTAPVFGRLASGTDGPVQALEQIDVWVTSKFLALSSKATNTSVCIDYSTIVVHGQQDDAVMLILKLSIEDDMTDDEHESVTIHIMPKATTAFTDVEVPTANGDRSKQYAADLYKAIGDCQELNPDPELEDDEEDVNTEPAAAFPAGGWITAENMHEYMDGEGNFSMPDQPLGQGAGSVRPAVDALDGEDEDAAKWQRID